MQVALAFGTLVKNKGLLDAMDGFVTANSASPEVVSVNTLFRKLDSLRTANEARTPLSEIAAIGKDTNNANERVARALLGGSKPVLAFGASPAPDALRLLTNICDVMLASDTLRRFGAQQGGAFAEFATLAPRRSLDRMSPAAIGRPAIAWVAFSAAAESLWNRAVMYSLPGPPKTVRRTTLRFTPAFSEPE